MGEEATGGCAVLDSGNSFIGESRLQKQLLSDADHVAQRNATVLITGESGTGKELLARYIHDRSQRSGKPYVTCDCASLPDTILEGELFGFRKGAFTGAMMDSPGYMRSSDGGTLFLDEIAELDLRAQTRLLRFLEDRTVVPLGQVKPLSVDTRIVAATHRNLETMMNQGGFRHDLYYRLNIVNLHIAPLRERRDDILPLAEYFRRVFVLKHDKKVVGFTLQAQAGLLSYHWPGNIRELRNAVERAVILSRGTWIAPPDLPRFVKEGCEREGEAAEREDRAALSFDAQTRAFQRGLLKRTLGEVQGNRQAAARRLQLSVHQIKYLIRKLGR